MIFLPISYQFCGEKICRAFSNYKALAKRVRYLKQDEEGVKAMCKMLEDMRNEAELERAKKIAVCMIKDGELPIEKIALYSGLSIDEIKELAEPVMV